MKPQYSYPGVYIEEVPTKPQPITGVSLSSPGDLSALRTIAARARKSPSGGPVLFTGPNGKAKLSAARALVGKLRRPLYRIDLSAVVSKYIGETEKNLSVIFDSAEGAGAILFFDEADALFGKRSEVKDAHDRYLNLAGRFHLRRLDDYGGLAIVATNQEKEALNPAFLRKTQSLICFPPKKAAKARQGRTKRG
jgi:SpoVK/Ycf46/Vps4 family AAA+-type ATPase